MNDINDYIPSPTEMQVQTIVRAKNRTKMELKSTVVVLSDIIKRRSADGIGYIGTHDKEVKEQLATCPFITWGMVVKVFRDAGYSIIGESNSISWATAEDIRKSE